MTPAELKLHCLELAMTQARIEGVHSDRNSVAQIAQQFYDLITSEAVQVRKPGRPKKDKQPDVFS